MTTFCTNLKSLNDRRDISITQGKRQSKTLLAIEECGSNFGSKCGSKFARNKVFYCHLSPVGREMAIKNSVTSDFLSTCVDSINVFDCRLPGVNMAQ